MVPKVKNTNFFKKMDLEKKTLKTICVSSKLEIVSQQTSWS